MQWDLMMVGTAMTNGMGEGFSWTDNEPGVEFIGMLNYGPFYALGYFTNVCCVQAYAFPVYTETDFAVGIRPAVGKFVFDLSAWWYVLGEYRDTSSDFWMVIASASYDVTDRLKVTGLVQWTADYANLGFDTHSPYLKAAYTFDKASKWTVSGGFGWYDFAEELPGNANYEFWDVGLAYQLSDMVSAEVRYHDSSRESGTPECLGGLDACGPAVAFRLTVATSMRQLLGSNGSDH
jgi:hypothetical protein